MVFNKQFINLYFTLPDDIKILIMEFNSQHRRLLSKTFQDIKLSAAFKRVDYLTKIYNNDCDSHFRNFTERQYRCFTDLINIYVNDHKYLFNSLKICNCCPRHMTNRPDNIKLTSQIESRHAPYQILILAYMILKEEQPRSARLFQKNIYIYIYI